MTKDEQRELASAIAAEVADRIVSSAVIVARKALVIDGKPSPRKEIPIT